MSITFTHCLQNFLSVIKKNQIRFDFLCFRIRSMHFDRKVWGIRKNGKTNAKISDSVCKDLYSEQCLKLCIASTSCVYLPLYNESLIVCLNWKSLWIKASAKLINVKCNDVIVWISTASTEEDQRLLLHGCLFSPAHWFYTTACLAPPTDSRM